MYSTGGEVWSTSGKPRGSIVSLIKKFPHNTSTHINIRMSKRSKQLWCYTHGLPYSEWFMARVGGCKFDSGSTPGRSRALLTGADALWQLAWMLHSSAVTREMSVLSRCIRLWYRGLWKCQWAARHRKALLMGQNVTALSYRSLTSIPPNAYCMGSALLSILFCRMGFTQSQMLTADVPEPERNGIWFQCFVQNGSQFLNLEDGHIKVTR